MEYKKARVLAAVLVDELQDYCDRIEIAGSIRRGKANVKDIEIVAGPRMTEEYNLFGEQVSTRNAIEHPLRRLELAGARYIKNGPRYKQLALPGGINLDLFLVLPPAQWGVILAIRTGPANFSQWIVTQRTAGGALPDGYRVTGGAVRRGLTFGEGEIVAMSEECDFLDFLGLGWIEPGQRAARWTHKWD